MLVLYGAGSYTVYVAASTADAATNGLIIAAGSAYISGPYESLPYLYAANTTAVLVTVVGYDGPSGMRFQHTNLASMTTLLGSPAGASVSADIAALKAVADTIATDTTTDIPALIGTPVADLATDIAGVQTDTTSIEGKVDTVSTAVVTTIPTLIGTPAAADVSADILVLDGKADTISTAVVTTIPTLLGTPAAADVSVDILVIDGKADTISTAVVTDIPATLATAAARYQGFEYVYTPVTDSAGWTTPVWIFTVTGDVMVKCVGICTESFTTSDGITLELGIAGNTAGAIAQIADATDLLINETWYDATPTDSVIDPEALSVLRITGGADIILTVTGTFTAGIVQFICWWLPLSATGNVVSAI